MLASLCAHASSLLDSDESHTPTPPQPRKRIDPYVNRDVIISKDDSYGNGGFFFTPFDRFDPDDGEDPFSTIELSFNELSRLIREKENWREKCSRADLQAKWRTEVQEQGGDSQLFELALQHVQLLANIGQNEFFEPSPVDHVYSSDSIIPAEILLELQQLADHLERVTSRDYHPGSEGLVVDLVHPSLYPLVVGQSRVRDLPTLSLTDSWKKDLGSLGRPVLLCFEDPTEKACGLCYSKKFQWLPAEFHVEADGSVHINSYINNLHPQQHAGMYPVLARIFSHCLPMLEQVLSDNIVRNKLRLINDVDSHDMYPDDPSDLDDDDDEAYEDYVNNRIPLEIPLPDTFPAENLAGYLQRNVSLRDKRLQVIVKLASIELTPEQPKYGGGAWHVEGMVNENIVCTLIHYYSCVNITESRLSFRQAIREPYYEQGDDTGVEYRFGLEDEDELNQELGHVVARQGRSVAFPNMFQHRVQPFELADKTRPGHRKILVYFLVDPFCRVTSTADVPPQQRSWLAHQHDPQSEPDSELHRLLRAVAPVPDDVITYMLEFLDFPLSRQAAENLREELMTERSYFMNDVNDEVFERPFSLCEH